MNQRIRPAIAIIVLLVLVGVVLGVETLRRSSTAATLAPGSVPIHVDGVLAGGFTPDDLDQLEQVSFQDAEEGKSQEGWLLRDVILLHVRNRKLKPDSTVTVISNSREKSADLTWAEVTDPANWVMFDLSGRGTLKLVSVLERLDTRDEWVQEVDGIEVSSP